MASSSELATTLRSKNAGVNQVTFDIIFPDRATYERVVRSGPITPGTMARLFDIPHSRISDFMTFDVAQRNQIHDLPRKSQR